MPLIELTSQGFYCAAGNFYIDPWRKVDYAVVTHAHTDHYTANCKHYLVSSAGRHVFESRLGPRADIQTLPYGETTSINGVKVSLHPAGHVLGSAQVRVEHKGEVWVVSGDYKLQADNTCTPFEPVKCHTFITEATFALPIYKWSPAEEIFASINAWWRQNQKHGRATMLYGYSLGKAQRLLAHVDSSIGPIYVHNSVEGMNDAYRRSGVKLPETKTLAQLQRSEWSQALIITPPNGLTTMYGDVSTAFASGWMRTQSMRRRRSMQKGFVLSDHADWEGTLQAIAASGAERIGVTHGFIDVLVRWLRGQGYEATGYATHFSAASTGEGG
ncbi:MAG: ligase-associated DNA damage response exonuclease [Chloroflexi bacterium]|nr:ligase-associated DNA damage response exonuclease [Chloroflexota bacterium]